MGEFRFIRVAQTFVALMVLALVFTGVPAGASSAPTRVTPDFVARAGSSNVVFVLASCGNDHCLRLYRSNMRGSSFAAVTLPPKVVWDRMGARILNSVSFATPNDGYAFVGPYDDSVVYVTTNGARSWHQLRSLHGLVGSIDVTESGIYALTAHCSLTTTNCDHYRAWRSSFAAAKWTLLPTLWKAGTNGRYFNSPPEIAGFDKEVWELETSPSGTVNLWTSTNEGKSFSRTAAPKLVSVASCSLTATSMTSLWAQCPTGMMVAFLHSSDAGAHWSSVSQGPFGGTAGGAFDPVTSTVAYLYYGADSVRTENFDRLTEGGAHSIAVSTLRCLNANALTFTNIERGLLLCANGTSSTILRTGDGGVVWSKVNLPRE